MSNENRPVISGILSVFLDSLRLLAALVVVFHHAKGMWFPKNIHNPAEPGNPSHAAVIVFFVLSGFVIAYTTTSNNRGPMHYAQARLSRLYSVLLPALLFTAIVEMIVVHTNSSLAHEFTRGTSWPRYLLTASFLNETWNLSAAPPINGPLWSLSYEFWYYAIFGLFFYRGKGWKSYLLPVAACLIAGPKILLLMPIWLAGFAAFRLPKPVIKPVVGWLLTIGCMIAATLFFIQMSPYPLPIGHHPFFFANQFLTDWTIGFFIAFSLWLMPSSSQTTRQPRWINNFRKIADLTFPIYVLHNPLLALWRSIFYQRQNDAMQLAIAIIAVLCCAVIMGLFLESQRFAWINFFKWLLKSNRTRLFKIAPYLRPSSKI